jgi:hypothetical protein
MHVTRRLDPEPLSIIAAIAGVTGACISATNYWRTHHKPSLLKVRVKLIGFLDKLDAEVRYLRTDVEEIAGIFQHASFPDGTTLRLGNGAMVTLAEFRRYERLTDVTLGRLRKMHKLALKVQGLAFAIPYVEKAGQVNSTGDALERADNLLRSRNLSVAGAWIELRRIVDELEQMIRQLNSELGRDGP